MRFIMSVYLHGKRTVGNTGECEGASSELRRRTRLWLLLLVCALVGADRLRASCPAPPTITCATNKTVSCATPWTNDPPLVTDTCCGLGYVLGYTAVTSGVCPQVIAFKWI